MFNRRGSSLPILVTPIGFRVSHSSILTFWWPGCLVPQLSHATGQIRVPDTVREGDYDLVCIGSPTWWLNPCMPIRSFMESDIAGAVLAGKRFAAIVVCHRYWKNNLATVKKLGVWKGR